MRLVRGMAIRGFLLLVALGGIASAGIVDSMWTRLHQGYNIPYVKYNTASRVMYDSARGRIYVCGQGETHIDPGQTDMIMLCYDLFGNLMWSHSVGMGLDTDRGYAMALCPDNGTVFLGGLVDYGAGANKKDIAVAKFDTAGNGTIVYSSQRDKDEVVYDMVYSAGRLFLAGVLGDSAGVSGQSAYYVVCLDTGTGSPPMLWNHAYVMSPFPGEGRVPPSKRPHQRQGVDVEPEFVEWDYADWDNCATSIAVAPDGDVVTAGFCWYSGPGNRDDYDWWVMKFSPTGTRRWVTRTNYPGTTDNDDDFAFDVAVGPDTAAYVVGEAYRDTQNVSSNDFAVMRFQGIDGARTAYTRVDQNNGDDVGFGVCVDDSSLHGYHVYATGFLETPGVENENIATVKLASSNLAREWLASYDGERGDDHGYEVYYKAGRVYVTGVRGGGSGQQDKLVALGYDAATTGQPVKDTLWSYAYHRDSTLMNRGATIVAADTNNVFVAGEVEQSVIPQHSSLYLSRLVIAHPDVALKLIVAPQDTYNIGSVVDTPRVWVKNQGNLLPTFKTYLRIGTGYLDSATTNTLKPGDSALVKFRRWTATPMGMQVVRCSAAVAPDINPANNVLLDTVYVALRDAACMRIVAPAGAVDSGTAVAPQAWIRNLGNMAQTFDVRFTVGASYADTQSVTIPSGDSVLKGFDPWIAAQRGAFAVLCSTMLGADVSDTNDRKTGNVNVRVRDVAMVAIVALTDTVDSGDAVVPQARVANRGSEVAAFKTFFLMEYGTDTVGYLDSLALSLAPGAESLVTFFPSPPFNRVGQWRATAWQNLADQHPENDTLWKTMLVAPPGGFWSVGWVEVASVPIGLSAKAVKGGGSVAVMASTGRLYAAKGYKTAEFYEYDPAADRWSTCTPIPPGAEGKLVSNGCDLCADGNGHVYATKGNNTVGFWKYTVADSSWTQMENVPLGLSGKKVKAGTGLAWVETGALQYVYMLKGYKNEFYRFNVGAGKWELRTPAPVGLNYKYDKGSFIVSDNVNTIYAHKSKYNELWKYDVAKDSWAKQLTGMPMYGASGRKKKSKDGGSGGWFNGMMYCLKGGNTQEFWRYTAATDSWRELDTVPQFGSSGRRKKVKDGGDIGYYAHAFWALKGNKTREFWRYGLAPAAEPEPEPPVREGVAGTFSAVLTPLFEVMPNPMTGSGFLRYSLPAAADVRVRAYTADGRLVAVLLSQRMARGSGMVRLNTDHLAAGIYLLRLDTGPAAQTRNFKLIVR